MYVPSARYITKFKFDVVFSVRILKVLQINKLSTIEFKQLADEQKMYASSEVIDEHQKTKL